MKKRCLFAAATCLALALPGAARAQAVRLTFDEIPARAVSFPSSLSIQGVTLDFEVEGVASPDARYNAIGPGNFTFVQGSVLEGDAGGILRLSFPVATPVLSFGVALTGSEDLSSALSVGLFGAGSQSLGVFDVGTRNLAGITEGEFRYSGALVSQAVINFNESALPPSPRRFALDNLSFQPIPEPATGVLLAIGVAGTAAINARKRRRTRRSDA